MAANTTPDAASQLPLPTVTPAPAATPSALEAAQAKRLDAQWTCKNFSIEKQNQPLDEKMTVGTKFILSCEGPAAKLNKEHLGLEIPKAQKYALRILQTRDLTDVRAEFVVTTWTAGDVKIPNLVLGDGTARVGLGEISFKVASVLKPGAPAADGAPPTQPPAEGAAPGAAAQPTPFPPYAPMKLPWPQWIWITSLVVLFVILLAIVMRISRSFRRKRLLKLLEKNPIALTPFHQFNKDLRKLSRQIPMQESAWDAETAGKYFEELEGMLKWYLSRELIVATFDRRPADMARDITKALVGKDVGDEAGFQRELRVTLAELDKARQYAALPFDRGRAAAG